MQQKRPKFPSAILWWEVLVTNIVSWIIKKMLDYAWGRGRERIKIKQGDIFLEINRIITIFSLSIFSIYWTITPDDPLMRFPKFPEMLLVSLENHKRLHNRNMISEKGCPFCKMINGNRENLYRIVPFAKLYPPFNE